MRPIAADLPSELELPLRSGSRYWYWLGGRPALDLVNTLRERWRRRVETLVTTDDLAGWLVQAGLLARPMPVRRAVLDEARELREGLPSLGPTLRTSFHLSLPQLGVILGSVSVGIVLTLIPWGALADRLGERRVIGAGLTGTALALVGASFASRYAALLAALVVAGMFGASATGASGRAVMGWFGRSQRGLALGIRQTGVPLGGGVAAVALPLIVAGFSLRAAL